MTKTGNRGTVRATHPHCSDLSLFLSFQVFRMLSFYLFEGIIFCVGLGTVNVRC